MKSALLKSLLLFSIQWLTVSAGFAQTPAKDPVPDLMKSAFAKYSRNDLGGASEDLAAVQKYIDDRRGAFGLRQLPDIAGWNATKAERKDGAILGAGTTMKRFYINGGKSVTAELMIDSPLVQQLAPLLTNQDIARAAGFEIRRIDGKEALIKVGKEGGELDLWLGTGMLFKLSSSPGMSENEVVSFSKNFDFKAMELLRKELAVEKKEKK